MFHFRDGWLFYREDNGTIKVQVRDYVENLPIDDSNVLSEIKIDPEEWASIIASLAIDGADESTVGIINIFHQGGLVKLIDTLLQATPINQSKPINLFNIGIFIFILSVSFSIIWMTIKHF